MSDSNEQKISFECLGANELTEKHRRIIAIISAHDVTSQRGNAGMEWGRFHEAKGVACVHYVFARLFGAYVGYVVFMPESRFRPNVMRCVDLGFSIEHPNDDVLMSVLVFSIARAKAWIEDMISAGCAGIIFPNTPYCQLLSNIGFEPTIATNSGHELDIIYGIRNYVLHFPSSVLDKSARQLFGCPFESIPTS